MSDTKDAKKMVLPPAGGPPKPKKAKSSLPKPGGPPKPSAPKPSALEPEPEPVKAVRAQAPGVRGRTEAPEQETLKTGESLGGRFVVEQYLGSSGGGVSYLCHDKETQEKVVVKVLDMPYPGDEEFQRLRREVGVASSIDQRNLTSAVGMGKSRKNQIFVAMEYVEGATLSRLIASRREEGRTLSLRDAFTALAHVCNALEAVHERNTCHGVLTPYNIYVNHSGVVKVGNLAIGRLVSTYLHQNGEGPFVDSIYVAPEVAENPKRLSPAADLYSLGMIAAEILSLMGLPGNRKQAHDLAVDAVSKYPPALFSLVSNCLSRDPGQRPTSVASFREDFEEVARDAGAQLTGAPPAGALPIEPAVEEEEGAEEFDLFDLGEIKGPEEAGEDRYLVQKSGLDYGPFTEEQILEQLYADEINEHSPVLDRITQERMPLQEFECFREAALEYIPVREERLRREAEARAELTRKAKKGGVAGLVVLIIGGIATLIGMAIFWHYQPDPMPLPVSEAFAAMTYEFAPPPTEFQAVALDQSLLESIFNPAAGQEEVARQAARARRTRPAASGGAAAPSGSGEEEVAVVDMGAAGGSTHHLTPQEINQVIMSDLPAIRECVMREVNNDRSFRGVEVQFFIRPSGTTGGVTLKETRYLDRPVGQCLVDRFRALRFPEHGAIGNRGVTFPLYLQ